jgi:hypothetical protein
MTEDLTTLTDDELHTRRRALYQQVQQPGCPREVVLEYDALTDERDRRHPPELARLRAVAKAAATRPNIFEEQEMRAASEGP